MAWFGARATAHSDGTGSARWRQAGLRARVVARRARRRMLRLTSVAAASSLLGAGLVPVAVVAGGAAAVTAAAIVSTRTPANASISGSVLILSTSVNGGTSSAEYQAATSLGLTATVVTPATWDAMTQSQFAGYNAIILGDPSTTSSCASSVPSDALSTAGTWGAAVNGNVAVLGTAPALGSASTLISDAIAYAASSGSGKTGLYVSLNCDYSTASAGTSVPLLASVEGGGFTVTGQGSNCPSAAGTVNTWQALALTQFNGLKSGNLGPWSSPACSVEETLNSWPTGLNGLGYDTGATPATFTASDGETGQAYIVAGAAGPGAPVVTSAKFATSRNGQVPQDATAGGGSNPAAPGVNQPVSGGVNTENGDFTQSATDFSIPTYGPSLDFTRTYDAQTAQQQTQTGTPGALGYGWTDNWASNLATAKPTVGDIYTLDGLRAGTTDGAAPGSAVLDSADEMIQNGADTYIADTAGNRILEIPGTTGTQWGKSMTAGDVYTIVGSPAGNPGTSPNGTPAGQALLNAPEGLSINSGNMYIADTGSDQVVEIPGASGTQWGVSMTAGDMYTIAGYPDQGALGGDAKPALQSHLDLPTQVLVHSGDLYIADSGNNRVQEVAGASETAQWGLSGSFTANDVYTIAGSASGTAGDSGNGGLASSARLNTPEGIKFSGKNDLYIADTGNNRIKMVAAAAITEWGSARSANDIYNIVGNGTAGHTGNGGAAGSAELNAPVGMSLNNGDQLYIADAGNNRMQEAAYTAHTEWGISMTLDDVYTIAGSASGTAGYSGDGGSALSALLKDPQSNSVTVSGGNPTMLVLDTGNLRAREVNSSDTISAYAGNGYSLATSGDGGAAVTGGLNKPVGEAFDAAGDVFIADSLNNRVQEIAATTHTQYGIAMTAGDVYTVAGSAAGAAGASGDGGAATAALLDDPEAVVLDSAGNLYIADKVNCRIQEVAASTGHISTVAGNAAGTTCGTSGDGGAATAALLFKPEGLAVDSHGDLYIADSFNNRIQEVFASGGQSFGQSMTAGDIYTVAGNSGGTAGVTGDGGAATSALLNNPVGLGVDGTGNLYIADYHNNRVQEVPVTTGTQRGQSMTRYDIYTIAGSAAGTSGTGTDGSVATSDLLNFPASATVDAAGNLYIADRNNNRVEEVPVANGTQWGISMTANDMYTLAGSQAGTAGNTGDGGPAASSLVNNPNNVSLDPAGNMYITDNLNDRLREVISTPATTIAPAPGLTSPWAIAPDGTDTTVTTWTQPGGITITQPGGAPITFYPYIGGACPGGASSPYVLAGQYCTLPENVGSSLTQSGGTYTFTPQPGTRYTYNTGGNLTTVSDSAGNTVNVAYNGTPGTGNCPAAASWCQIITAANGRALTVGYNGSNLVTSVTDPLGRRWAYAYTGSDLTSASDPMSPANVTSYTYGAGSTGNPLNANDLLTITKPNGQTGGSHAGAHTALAYDASGRVTSQTDPMGYTTSYDWSGLNASTGTGTITVADPDGNKTIYAYTAGSLAAQSAWTGTTLTSEEDFLPDQTNATQLDTASQDGNGNISTTSYDANGNPTATTAPDGVATQTATTTQQSTGLDRADCTSDAIAASTCTASPGPTPVSPGGVITPPSSIPPQGVTWTLYDTNGNQLYTTTGVYPPGGSTASYARTTYHLFKNNSITLNSTNITCTTAPPSASLPCATINANGVVTQLAYDSAGDLTSSSTPDGNGSEQATTTNAYDGDGEQTATTSPDGNLSGANAANYTTATAYNADGQKISVTKGSGTGLTVTPRTTSYGYDPSGNQTTIQDARGFTTTTSYNADDQATLVTDPDGNATLTCYDGDGNAAQTVLPVGVAANSLTPASCPTSYPAGYSTQLASDATADTFNALGQKTQEITPAPAGQTGHETTTYTYDGNGNLTQTTAPPTANGGPSQVTVDTYTSTDQVASETHGYGTSAASTISYCYDPNGDKTSTVYGDGNASGVAPCETSSPWVVDSTAHQTQASYQTTYSYDSAGELFSTTSPATAAAPSGATTTSTYDPAGNTLTRKDPNGVTTTWTYTPLNKPATVSYSGSSAHSVTSTYDANGNKTGMADATGTSSYSYDPFGELSSTTNGAGQTTGYSYDTDGNPATITYPLPATATWATSHTVTYGYDHADMPTSVTDFNGNTTTIANTADGQPNSVTLGTTGDTITATYDPTGLPSAIALKNSTSTLQSFTYSDAPAGNILSETDTPASSNSPATYTYDSNSRVTSMTPGTGATLNYGFDASSNLTTLPTGGTGTYDNAGELSSSSLAGTTTSYTYNADGQRVAAKQGTTTIASGTWNGAGQLTSYNNSSANMTAAAYDGNGMRTSSTITPSGGSAVTQGYVWNTVAQVPEMIMDGTSAYIYGNSLTPAEQVSLTTGTITYLVTDLLGSVRGTVNSTGGLTGTTCYDAWGNPETAGGLAAATPFGYAGGYTDPDGLIYLLNRYYEPSTGQFISVDPQIAQTIQPYTYANGDPVANTDPNGELAPGKVRCYYPASWHRYCDYTFYRKATHIIIETLIKIHEFGEGCDAIAEYIPEAGEIIGVICLVINGGAEALARWLTELNNLGGNHGIIVRIWSLHGFWGWIPVWAWPRPRYIGRRSIA